MKNQPLRDDPTRTSLLPPRRQVMELPFPDVFAETGPDLAPEYLQILWRRKGTLIFIACLGLLTSLLLTLPQKPIYQARGSIEIQSLNENFLNMRNVSPTSDEGGSYAPGSDLQTQARILQSESLLDRVVAKLDLGKKLFPEEGRDHLSAWRKAFLGEASTRDKILTLVAKNLKISTEANTRLIEIRYDSTDPQLATDFVNTLIAEFVQQNIESHWKTTQQTGEWLTQRVEDVRSKLEKSEDDLQAYAQNNGLLFLETEKGDTENIVDERLRQLQDELTKAQADRYTKESLYRLVQAGDYSSLPGVVDNKLMQDLTERLADLQREEAELTPTFTSDYPKVKQIQSQVDDVQKTLNQERKRAAQGIVDDYQAAVRREALVREAFDQQQQQANLVAGRAVQYNILKREVDTNKQLYEGLLQRLKEAGVSAGMNASNIRIVDAAVPPTKPVSPRPVLNLGLALLLGLGCGVGVAFLQEHWDNTLKDSDDIERVLRVPALALIPARDSLNDAGTDVYGRAPQTLAIPKGNGKHASVQKVLGKAWIRIDGNGTQHSALSEAFRGLRTSVLLSAAGRPPRSLTFVSAEPGEGKTTVACNLAISLAQLGKRVLLIDGDMRRPCVHKLFDIENHSQGLVTYLTEEQEWRHLVRPTGMANLDCLVCGPVPPNPSELLSSDRMQVLIREALTEYQFVLIDAPPLLNVADGRILATMVEGAILVVKGGFTPRDLAQQAQLHIRDVGAHLIGVVLNDVDVRHNGYYKGYYRYGGYGENSGAEKS